MGEELKRAYDALLIMISDHTLPDEFYKGYMACISDLRNEGKRMVIENFNTAFAAERERRT